MAKFVFAMNVSLDGYVDHDRFAPDPELFRHWIEQVSTSTAAIYGRKIYELMRYWEVDQPDWDSDRHAFARAWRKQPKWVVSRTLTEVGPNVTLVTSDLGKVAIDLKSRLDGQIDVCGTLLAQSLGELGLIDSYRMYFHPVVLGSGKPYFALPRPPLHLTGSERIGPAVIRVDYNSAHESLPNP
jgi:dihydrofolate reductase